MKPFLRTVAIASGCLLVGYILVVNSAPWNVVQTLTQVNMGLSPLAPSSRATYDGAGTRVSSNFIYLNSSMSFKFNRARASLGVKALHPDQEVWLGYRDEVSWHYNSTVISAPFIDALHWPRVGSGPYLYQKAPSFKSVDEFMNNMPKDKVIGVYDYDALPLRQEASIPGYQPAKQDTVIDTPLRGKTTMYVYVKNEPFKMTIQKRDLNWYDDPDVVNVKVYKQMDKVFEATIDDDGNSGHDHRVGAPQDVTIANPGPGLPENGVYKVMIDCPTDAVVTRIQTNLHKVAFDGPIYPVNNAEVYGGLVDKTTPTMIYTDAPSVRAVTYHQALQSVGFGGASAALTAAQTPVTVGGGASGALTPVSLPKSDAVVSGVGYFAFTPDEFFAPTPYHLLEVQDAADLDKIDYLLTNYSSPKQLGGGWVEATREFDLSDAVTQKGKLSWLISAPGLSDNHRTIEIKNISMTLTKQGWWKK